MNFSLSYYAACYKLCALGVILHCGDIKITEDLSAEIGIAQRGNSDPMFGWERDTGLLIRFLRCGKIVETIRFEGSSKKYLENLGKLLDDNYDTDVRLGLIEQLKPGVLSTVLKSKPLLTDLEQESVKAAAEEMYIKVLKGESNVSSTQNSFEGDASDLSTPSRTAQM